MSRRANDEGVQWPSGTAFEVMQFLAKPFSSAWRKDRKHLVKGRKALIDEEQIRRGLSHKTIKRYMVIPHNRCKYTQAEEEADTTGRIFAGDDKFVHYHIYLDTGRKYMSADVIARWFGVEPQYVNVLKGAGAFLDGCDYGLHETPKAIADGKTHYNADEAWVSPGFDLRAELDELHERKKTFGRRASGMNASDVMRMNVLLNGWSMQQCRREDPLTYSKVRSSLPPLRLDYLFDAPPCPLRLNFYVDGPPGSGKTQFCNYLAESMFPDVEYPYFPIGGDERVTFDGYDGEPCLIWNDMRAYDFISRFGPNGSYRILDPHPQKQTEQAKHSRVILTNALNIINGVQPYAEFINGLAGTYVDRDGHRHVAEDDTQAWRRFPLIICIHPEQFDVLVNKGFLDPEAFTAKQVFLEKRVRANLRRIFTGLDGEAKEREVGKLTAPVVETAQMVVEKHDAKISDPGQLPDEFADYGTVVTRDDLMREYEEVFIPLWKQVHARGLASGKVRMEDLVDFDEWCNYGSHNAYDWEKKEFVRDWRM